MLPVRPSGKPRTRSPGRAPTDPLTNALRAAGLGDAVRDALVRVLARQMSEDHFAKLEQAGDTDHDGIPLRRVFVDLNSSDRPHDSSTKGPFVKELLGKAPQPIGGVNSRESPHFRARRGCAGFVLIGGPGQGKSTVGQLACQMHRAAWLAPYEGILTDKERRALADLTEDSRIGRPHTPSMPVRISLPDAAAWLAGEQQRDAKAADDPQRLSWILRFWCARLPDDARAHLPPANLLALLKVAPFLLVLDGLDEVPATGARERVLSAVRGLGEALSGADARGLLLATTRPQGYAGELDGLGVPLETRYLAPLTPEQALDYATRLAGARVPDGAERTRVVERLTEASRESATQRLLTTPLQVTILVALVIKGGQLPRERWNLFDQYYNAIYAREANKLTDAAELLKSLKTHIGAIHARAGLLLQVESENADRTEALLARDRLEAIAEAVLSEEGFSEPSRRDLVARIVRAAEQRLVFLVEPQSGKFGFEIRSLQEFMAAKALAAKSDLATKTRLSHVARAGSFRNVTLFLAGKLFAEGGDLRDTLAREICPALQGDQRDPVAKAAGAGAVLALDVLEEGSAMSQPKRAADLMRVAISVLDLPSSPLQARLARLLKVDSQAKDALSSMMRDALQARLSRESVQGRLGAWTALLSLTDDGPTWAAPIANAAWPKSVAEQQLIVEGAVLESRAHGMVPHLDSWLWERIEDSLALLPRSFLTRIGLWARYFRSIPRASVKLQLLIAPMRERESVGIRFRGGATLFYDFTCSLSHSKQWNALLAYVPKTRAWSGFATLATFAAQPSRQTLGRALRALSESGSLEEARSASDSAPWPLAGLVAAGSSVEHLLQLAELAEEGHFGDLPLWQAAETHWRAGVDFQDLLAVVLESAQTPWQTSSVTNAPLFLLHFISGPVFEDSEHLRLVEALWGAWKTARPEMRQFLAQQIATVSSHNETSNLPILEIDALEEIVPYLRYCPRDGLWKLIEGGFETAHIVARWGVSRPQMQFDDDWVLNPKHWRDLAEWYTTHTDSHGVLYFLGVCAGEDATRLIPPSLLDRSRFDDLFTRADAWLVRLSQGSVSAGDVPTLLQDTQAATVNDAVAGHRLLLVLRNAKIERSLRDTLLAQLVEGRFSAPVAAQGLRDALSILQGRTSDLDQPAAWIRLDLPLPRPLSAMPSAPSAVDVFHAPVHLRYIELQNIRSLERLELKFEVPKDEQGQWIVLLGENSSGKSTVLRSIVLALRNLSDPQVWPKGTFAFRWRRLGIDPDKEQGSISVTLADGTEYATRIQANGKEVFVQSPPRSIAEATPFLLWGYGCRRGSALGGADRAVNVKEDDGPDIATLFDEGASLVHAQTWLETLDGAASREATGLKRDVFNAVIAALKKILDVDEIEFDEDSKVVVTGGRVGERVPLEALSDGYVTTAGWVVDLLARWIARAQQVGLEVTADFPRKMTGLVLLDEVDLHLHPAWQLEAIPRIREIFPRLSFVVTTHNPLTLVGARPEEIWILSRNSEGAHAEQRVDVPALLTGAQLFSRFFGISGFFPNDLGQKLQRYGFLAGNAHRSEAEQQEMEVLRTALHDKGIVPGWEEIPRAVETPKRRQRRRSSP